MDYRALTVRELVVKAAELMTDIQQLEKGIMQLRKNTGDINEARFDERLAVKLLVDAYDARVEEHDNFMDLTVEIEGNKPVTDFADVNLHRDEFRALLELLDHEKNAHGLSPEEERLVKLFERKFEATGGVLHEN